MSSRHSYNLVVFSKVSDVACLFRSQAARGKEGIKDGVSEMGTRLDPVPGLPGGVFVSIYKFLHRVVSLSVFFALFFIHHPGKKCGIDTGIVT